MNYLFLYVEYLIHSLMYRYVATDGTQRLPDEYFSLINSGFSL